MNQHQYFQKKKSEYVYGADLIHFFSKKIKKIEFNIIVRDIPNNFIFTRNKFIYQSDNDEYIFLKPIDNKIYKLRSLKHICSIQLVWTIQIVKVWNNDDILIDRNQWSQYDIL